MAIVVNKHLPEFEANATGGVKVSHQSHVGQTVILYFYPKDDTPGCTAEACSLRDNYQDLISQGYAILGVSPDTEAKHQKFIAKYNLPFDLLADIDNAVALAYGVWVEKSMYGRKYMGIARTTFVIDEQGNLAEIIEKVDTKNHATQIIK